VPALLRSLLYGVLSTVVSAALTVPPVLIFRHGTAGFTDHWQELAFYAIAIAGGGVSGLLGFRMARGEKELIRQRLVVWAGCAFVFLYVACAALCERLGLGVLDSELYRNLGVALLAAGSVIRLWAIATLGTFHSALVAVQTGHHIITRGPYRWLRHPSYLGLLIFLTGVPMVFAAWFPLLALPGCFVALRWRITDEEAFLISEFTDDYESYKKRTWRLIPFLY